MGMRSAERGKMNKKKSSTARSLPVENYYHRMWGQLSTTCSNVLKQPNGELLVAVNHNQLRSMASETVDRVDWSHPHPHGQYHLSASRIV